MYSFSEGCESVKDYLQVIPFPVCDVEFAVSPVIAEAFNSLAKPQSSLDTVVGGIPTGIIVEDDHQI